MRLAPLGFEGLAGWSAAEVANVWPTFLASCAAIVTNSPPLRAGRQPERRFVDLCRAAAGVPGESAEIEKFFRSAFRPYRVFRGDGDGPGFITGYYQPDVNGSLNETPRFRAAVLARPSDLIDVRAVEAENWDRRFEGARLDENGVLEPYPDRAAIEGGAISGRTQAILWLEDHVEVFFAQVQGSARVRLPDGRRMRLIYDGRNGRPYSSIGRALIEGGEIPADEMSLSRCKAWLRSNGLEIGQAARAILQRNESYVFFRLEPEFDPKAGPVGGQGLPLTAMRSIAVDRNVWTYGTPVWINADLSLAGLGAGPSGRLVIAQDTGSAIVGPARGDLFIGAAAEAGRIAGNIRHPADFIVFLPAGPR